MFESSSNQHPIPLYDCAILVSPEILNKRAEIAGSAFFEQSRNIVNALWGSSSQVLNQIANSCDIQAETPFVDLKGTTGIDPEESDPKVVELL